MDDAAGGARSGGTLREGQNVMYPGAQNLDGGVVAEVFAHPEYRAVELERTIRIRHGEPDHGSV